MEPCGRHALLSIRSFGERIKVDSWFGPRDHTAKTQRCCQLKQHLGANDGRNFTKQNKRMNVCPRSGLRSNVYPMKKIHDYKTSVLLKLVTSIRQGFLVSSTYVVWIFQRLIQWWSGELYKIGLRMDDKDTYLFPFHVGFKNGRRFAFTSLMQLQDVVLRQRKFFSFSEQALRE
jgi:hypothetical protein